jgi:hypothetical protein
VLERWAGRPRGIRWLVGKITVVVLVVAIVWVLFVPASDWLAYHDVGSATGSLHEMALISARDRFLTLVAVLFAGGAVVFTALSLTRSHQAQATERYIRAVEQLGSDKLDVRIGGIYALERVARDSARDHPTVMDVLCAFIREHSHEPWPPPDHPASREPEPSTRPDVQAAVTVIGRRDAERDIGRIDLTGARLTRASLACANLTNTVLISADLTSANLIGANLTRANLMPLTLPGTDPTPSTLTGAYLGLATLTHAMLPLADLTCADLSRADLTGANLRGADLTGANLTGTYLAGADLAGADLTSVKLTSARWPPDVEIPRGWKVDIGSGRLEAMSGDAGPAEPN